MTDSKKLLIILLSVLIFFKLFFWIVIPPFYDEAYYWLWGRTPSLSYHDHPPMQAWIQSIFYSLFGRSQFVLRLPALVCTLIIALVYFKILKKLNYSQESGTIVLGILITPIIFFLTSVAWNDYIMIVMVLYAAYFFVNYLSDIWNNQKGSSADILLGFLFVGLSGISKYNSVFIVFAIASVIISNKKLHSVFKDYRFYLGLLIALVCISPIFVWNIQNENGSFESALGQRTLEPFLSLKFRGNFLGFLLGCILTLSPFVLYGIIRSIKRTPNESIENEDNVFYIVYRKLAIHTFFWSSITTLLLSTFSVTMYWWNILAYLLILPIALKKLQKQGKIKWHFVYSVILNFLLLFHLGILPFTALFGLGKDQENAYLYGWDKIENRIKLENSKYPEEIPILTTDYRTASLLNFTLDRSDIYSYSLKFDQFDYWTAQKKYTSKTVLVFSDDFKGLNSELTDFMESINIIDTIRISKWGYHIKDYYLSIGKVGNDRLVKAETNN